MDVDIPMPQLVGSGLPQHPSAPSPCFNLDSIAGRPLRFSSPTAAGVHLSTARAALQQARRLKKKRKSQEGLTEIRKQEQRACKRICNARTRRGNIHYLDEATSNFEGNIEEQDIAVSEIVSGVRTLQPYQTISRSPTNRDRVPTTKVFKLDERNEVTQIGLRKREFVARKVVWLFRCADASLTALRLA